jgi:hypothetical protein
MDKSLMMVALYFIVLRIVTVLTVFPISKLIETIGFRRSITLSVIFLIAYTASLLMAETNFNWLWVSAICAAINTPLYWVSRDSALSQDVPAKEMGSRTSKIAVLESIAGLLAPFTGGAIVLFLGYQMLFGASLIILALSILPLWWMPHHTHRNGVSLRGFWYFMTNGRYLHQIVASVGIAMNDYGNSIIWPLLLFLQGIGDEKLGGLYSLVAVITIIVQYVSGKWFDRLRARKDYSDEGVYGIATLGLSASWIARMLVRGISQILPLDLLRQVFEAVSANFYRDYTHLGGKRMGSIAFWVYMEVAYSVGAIFLFCVMILGVYFGVWKEMVLSTIAVWSLASMVLARESNMR